MTNLASAPVHAGRRQSRGASDAAGRIGFGRALHSEWVKLSTLRSNWVTAIILFLDVAGMPVLTAVILLSVLRQLEESGQTLQVAASDLASLGQPFGLIIAAVLGILTIGGEYSTGSIRSSLVAVPRRWMLLAAKALMAALAIGAVALLGTAVGIPSALAVLDAGGQPVDMFADDGLARLGLSVLSIMLFALLAVGVATLVRSTAGSITIVVVLVFVAPAALQFANSLLNAEWLARVLDYLPSSLATTMLSWPTDPSQPSWWGATLALAAWAFVPLLAGMAVFQRRDA